MPMYGWIVLIIHFYILTSYVHVRVSREVSSVACFVNEVEPTITSMYLYATGIRNIQCR